MKEIFRSRVTVLRFVMTFFLIISIIASVPMYLFTKSNLDTLRHREAQILAESAKKEYMKKSEVLDSLNPTINEYIELKLLSTSKEIYQTKEKVSKPFLIELAKQQNLSGIWLIEKDGFVRISTQGTLMNAKEWYPSTDRPEVEWNKILTSLLNNKGQIWIDPKYARASIHPHDIHKWGYMGLGDIPHVGTVVLEVGLSIEDIISNESLLAGSLAKNNDGTGITDIEIIRNNPNRNQELDKELEQMYLKRTDDISMDTLKNLRNSNLKFNTGQTEKEGKVTTYLVVEDKLIGTKSQMIVTTSHKDLNSIESIMLTLIVLAPLMVVLLYLVTMYTLSQKKTKKGD